MTDANMVPLSRERTELMMKINDLCQGQTPENIGACIGDLLCFLFSMHDTKERAITAGQIFGDNLVENIEATYQDYELQRAANNRRPS